MAYQSPYNEFIFESYSFDLDKGVASFNYSFDGERHFKEQLFIPITDVKDFNQLALDGALQLSFYLSGTSYYKTFPTKKVKFKAAQPDKWQAEFLQRVYTEGLSQFMFENKLTQADIAVFEGAENSLQPVTYDGKGSLVLQSGGKDSLLLATLLEEKDLVYTPWYVSSSDSYPNVLDSLSESLQTVRRKVDQAGLKQAAQDDALNGHVPVTYIVESYALINAILLDKNIVLASIGAEGEEPHDFIGDMPVNHQWSKTWVAEQLLAEYVQKYTSADLQVGSPLRGFSELKIAELFVKHAWSRFGHSFSSCNKANYQQGADNTHLKWCGDCPKCANSYLLFAPFVEPKELQLLFAGQDLFTKLSLTKTFKGLLGIDKVMKPFECVGETAELRTAYHMAQDNFGVEGYKLPFDVPKSDFDYKKIRSHNKLAPDLYNL